MPGSGQPGRKVDFYPRPPCGGRPACKNGGMRNQIFLSTSPLRGTTRNMKCKDCACYISIHVPLAGDDNIPTPTHCRHRNFYPRPPCGGRHQQRTAQAVLQSISIHVPLAGDDGGCMIMEKYDYLFLSTSPLRGTTRRGCRVRSCYSFLSTSPLRGTTAGLTQGGQYLVISIHVPLAGDDAQMRLHGAGGARISIHVPLAGDDVQDADLAKRSVSISIHVPLAGDDPLILFTAGKGVDFYPRPPCGGRLAVCRSRRA